MTKPPRIVRATVLLLAAGVASALFGCAVGMGGAPTRTPGGNAYASSSLDEVRRLACEGRWDEARRLALRHLESDASKRLRTETAQVLAETGAGGDAAAEVLGSMPVDSTLRPGLLHAKEATIARRHVEVGNYDAALPLLLRCVARWNAARQAAGSHDATKSRPAEPAAKGTPASNERFAQRHPDGHDAAGPRAAGPDRGQPRPSGRSPADAPQWTNPEGDASLAGEPVAHAMERIAPRCLEDLIFVQQQLGHHDEAAGLLAWQEQLWKQGPDLADELRDNLRRGREAWHDDATTSRLMRDLAFHELHKQRSERAIALLEGALALLQRAAHHGEPDPGAPGQLPRCRDAWLAVDEWQMLAEARAAAGQADAARTAWARAVAVADARMHPRHVARLSTRAGLARAADAAADRRACVEAWHDYTALAVALRGPGHPDAERGRAARCAGPRLPVSHRDPNP